MKRITYVSRQSVPWSREDVDLLGRLSAQRNERVDVTGALLVAGDLFFQTLEGPGLAVDQIFGRIRRDRRHRDLFCLESLEVHERLYPRWAMRTLRLDEIPADLGDALQGLFRVLLRSHAILARYTQPSIVQRLDEGLNPLELRPELTERVVLFADVFGFSTFASVLAPDELLDLVNRFFDCVTRAVILHGGEVNKYIGDCVMACFPRTRAADALRCAVDCIAELAELRETAPAQSPLGHLHCGVGLAAGSVVEGNVGSSAKLDFTVLGEVVNDAAWAESQTRHLGHWIAATETVFAWAGEKVPRIALGARRSKIDGRELPLFAPDHPLVAKRGPLHEDGVSWLRSTLGPRR